jgi:hypothetical protein
MRHFFEESQKLARQVKGRDVRKRGYTSYSYTKIGHIKNLEAL